MSDFLCRRRGLVRFGPVNPLGDDLLPLLLLALGGAMVVGTVAALARPPASEEGSGLPGRPPLGRSIAMIVVGGIAAVWALASLVSG